MGAMTRDKFPSSQVAPPESLETIRGIVCRALDEDIGDGDVTTECTVPHDTRLQGELIAKQRGVVAGLEVAWLALTLIDEHTQLSHPVADGDPVEPGQLIVTVEGPGRAVLVVIKHQRCIYRAGKEGKQYKQRHMQQHNTG